MMRLTIAKIVFAVVFTFALTFGAGIVADQLGVPVTQTVYACVGSNGGGC